MITKIFNAQNYFNKMITKLSQESTNFHNYYNKQPTISIIIIGNNFPTNTYIKNKILACITTHIIIIIFKFNKTIYTKTLTLLITLINKDDKINAILIQLPIPINLNKKIIFSTIKTNKDIDLLNPLTFGNHITGYDKKIYSCTSKSILTLLNILKINISGLIIALYGFSNIVGKPVLFDLFTYGATIISINKHDKNQALLLKKADIIIVAVGITDFLNCKNTSYGAIIIDIGINNLDNKLIVGDVNIRNFLNKAKYITPVPGGVGLLTIINLLSNTLVLSLMQERGEK